MGRCKHGSVLISPCIYGVFYMYMLIVNTTSVKCYNFTDTPHYLVTLPDKELLCYGFQGIPLFPYSLISTELASVNSYVNISSNPQLLSQNMIGVKLINNDENALRGMNIVRVVVEGDTAYVNDMGGIDIKDKTMLLEMKDSDVEFEVASSQHTEVKVKLQEPPAMVRIIAANDGSFNVLIEGAEIKNTSIHGIMGKKINSKSMFNFKIVFLGQFLQKGVHVDKSNKLLLLPGRGTIPIYQSHVWPELQLTEYKDKSCWRPEVGHVAIEGENYDYITDHITGTKFKFSCSKLK